MKAFFPYSETTAGITVRAAPRYVQLLSRHWIITAGDARVDHVRGEGVVGDQPVIVPGGSYDYVSGCPLPTSSGTMTGTFTMAARETLFEVAIPLFSLDTPGARVVH